METGINAHGAKVLAAAEWAVMQEFREFVNRHTEAGFFDPRNRDEYMRAFAAYLARTREFASND